jgi:hypothetical protein
VIDQIGPYLEELATRLEHHVRGDFCLHPETAALVRRSDGRQDRVEELGEGIQDPGPGPVGESSQSFETASKSAMARTGLS